MFKRTEQTHIIPNAGGDDDDDDPPDGSDSEPLADDASGYAGSEPGGAASPSGGESASATAGSTPSSPEGGESLRQGHSDRAGHGRTRSAPGAWWEVGSATAHAARTIDFLEGLGAVDVIDVSSICGEADGRVLLVERDDGFELAVTTESAYATKVVPTAEALAGPRAADYRVAIQKEMGGHLEKFKSFTLLPISSKPPGVRLIDMSLILAEKYGAFGDFVKAKARLVARGDQQRVGRDFGPFDTTAPALRMSSLRMLCALAAMTGRTLSSSDGEQAYLQADLAHKVWARLPKQLRECNADGEELVALCQKAIYGLAVSGQNWNKEINGHLTGPRAEGGMGFTRCAADPCMYVRRDGDVWAIAGLATDGIIHLESSDAEHADVLGALQGKYVWVDEGLVSDVPAVLGTKITQDVAAGTVTLSQEGYIDSLAEEYATELPSRKPATPAGQDLEGHVREALDSKAEARDPALVHWYQRIVGALIWASIVSRPDICWAVGMLSRAMAYPTAALRAGALRCLAYLATTKALCLNYSRSTYFSARSGTTVGREGDDALGCISIDERTSDSDFAAGPSVSGWEWRLAGAAVLYGSKRQSGTMLSSAAAELVAGSVAATDGVFFRNVLGELGWTQSRPTKLWIDNNATVAMAHNPMGFHKTKHVARRHHFLRECVEARELDVRHIRTEFNVSDIFTKALEGKKFRLFRAAVMNLPLNTVEG